jgi:hypothetical protein
MRWSAPAAGRRKDGSEIPHAQAISDLLVLTREYVGSRDAKPQATSLLSAHRRASCGLATVLALVREQNIALTDLSILMYHL